MTNIDYHLKLLLKSSTLSLTQMADVRDSNASALFKKKYSNTRTIYAFIRSKNLVSSNIEVPMFGVPINFDNLQHKVFYCEVAVGKSLYVSKEYAMMCQPPSDYDSFIVKLNNEEEKEKRGDSHMKDSYLEEPYKREEETQRSETSLRKKSGEGKEYVKYIEPSYSSRLDKQTARLSMHEESKPQPGTRQSIGSPLPKAVEDLTQDKLPLGEFHYIIKDPNRVNIIYEVSFNYDRMLDQKEKGQCEMCLKNPSVMFCLAERASFCKYCDASIHDNEFTQRHNRYYYDVKDKKKFISCSHHFDSIVDFYCETCMVPVCSLCKIHGNHSTPPNSTHRLIKFLDACDLIKEKMQEEDEDMKMREERINENITIFKEDLEEFNKMVALTRSKIESEYKTAINELNSIARKKYQVYNAMYIEKTIVKEKITRVRTFIKESEGGQNVKDYRAITDTKEEMIVCDDRIKRERIILKGGLSLYYEEGKRESKGSDSYVESSRKY